MRMPPAVRRLVATLIPALGLILLAGTLAAAQESAVPPGTKIRFELRNGERHAGRVISLGREGLETGLPSTGATTRYPLDEIAKMEIVGGRHRPVLRGLVVGTAVGATFGRDYRSGLVLTLREHGVSRLPDGLREPRRVRDVRRPTARRRGPGRRRLPQGLIPRDRWEKIGVDGSVVRLQPAHAAEQCDWRGTRARVLILREALPDLEVKPPRSHRRSTAATFD